MDWAEGEEGLFSDFSAWEYALADNNKMAITSTKIILWSFIGLGIPSLWS
jgi:hypothetical protein